MIDGRSIYTLLYAGVYWENQDMVLDDIDRIEVIRGPGAAIWGANAVNGVINIITKDAAETQGTHIAVSSGTVNTVLAGIRYGGAINENAHYRVSLKYRDQPQFNRTDGTDSYDGMQIGHGSFRTDWNPNLQNSLSLQGTYYNGTIEENMIEALPVPPYSKLISEDDDSQGWDLVGSWKRRVNSSNQLDVKFYYDNAYRDSFFYSSDIDTWDLALQQQFDIGSQHNLIYGFRYRYTVSDSHSRSNLSFSQNKRFDYLYSFFIQDEIGLFADELFFTLGSKFEYQSFSDFEVQPTARLLWKVNGNNSVWTSISRSVRSPSIGELDMAMEGGYTPVGYDPSQLLGLWVLGNPDLDSEKSIAYEGGYRTTLTSTISMDLALFYIKYDDVRGFTALQPEPILLPVPHIRTGLQMANNVSGYSYGFEVSADWKPLESLSFHVNYSNLQIKVDTTPDLPAFLFNEFEGRSPTSLLGLSMNWMLRHDLDVGLYLYSSSDLDYTKDPVPSYVRCDLRLAWRPVTGMELSLVGQNLFDSDHTEYPATDALLSSDIPQSIYAGLTLDF